MRFRLLSVFGLLALGGHADGLALPPGAAPARITVLYDAFGGAHPGIETILGAAAAVTPDVALVVGGLHWLAAPDSVIARLTTALHDTWHVRQVAPGHCTGEPGFAALQQRFGPAYLYAGLGSVLERATGDSGLWTRHMSAVAN